MKFGEVRITQAVGSVLAHSLRLGPVVLKKGRLLSAADVEVLRAAQITRVTVAQLDAADVLENDAADALASALVGEQAGPAPGSSLSRSSASTGRVNLFASVAGLALIDARVIEAVNQVHEALTVATLPAFSSVAAGQMIATVKIIPYAVPRAALQECLRLAVGAGRGDAALQMAAYRPMAVGLAMTQLPQMRPSLLAKMRHSVLQRIEPLGSALAAEQTVPHAAEPLAAALRELLSCGCELLLICGAAAIVDRGDVVPRAVELAGGEVLHLGMPVDPGNLLLLARCGSRDIVGLPSCARSPKLNGFDFVLRRLAARLPVKGQHITSMGVGGLLSEIASRPAPRVKS